MKNLFDLATEYAKHIERLLYNVATRTGKSIEDVYLDAKRKSELDGISMGDILESICAEYDKKVI